MTSPVRLWLVRHGETAWSREGRHTGRTDVPLTERGERAARAVGRELRLRPLRLALTSPLRRARDTCTLAGLEVPCRMEPDLQEWDYGAYEGRTTAEIRSERPGWTIWDGDPPAGETLAALATRAGRVLALAEAESESGELALFAHGHLLRVLAALWLGLEPAAGRLLALDAGSLSALGHEHGTRVLVLWNWAVLPAEEPEGEERAPAR